MDVDLLHITQAVGSTWAAFPEVAAIVHARH
jgi:hypothetical protein